MDLKLNINIDGVTWNFCALDIQVHESCFDPCASYEFPAKQIQWY